MEYDCLNGEYYEYVCCFDSFLNNENFAIMQYTGLHDKNGKEIYEGDILHIYGKIGGRKYCENVVEETGK